MRDAKAAHAPGYELTKNTCDHLARIGRWLSILCIYAYVASFAIGLGPIPFLIMSELLPTKAVASGTCGVLDAVEYAGLPA